MLTIEMLVGALHTLRQKFVAEDQQERSRIDQEVHGMVHSGEIDEQQAGSLHYAMTQGVDYGFQELMYQFPALQDTQRNTLYCHVINTLENYFISVGKTITRAYPNKFSSKDFKIEISLPELLLFSTENADLWDHLFISMVTREDKGSNLNGTYKYLTKKPSALPDAEENLWKGIRRAILVRHRLTHRGGLVDSAFLTERNSIFEQATGVRSRYASLGMQDVTAGNVYQVSEEELIVLIEAANKLALHFEEQFHKNYSDICRYSVVDDYGACTDFCV